MISILDKIVINRREDVSKLKLLYPLTEIKSKIDTGITRNSLSKRLQINGASGIIAEFKRRSPSKGIINDRVNPEVVTRGYADAGATGLSILTEETNFGGSVADFSVARKVNPTIPLLRKDFMVDEYQIYEAAMMNADVILLIAAVLSKFDIDRYTAIAHDLGMEVLLELHDESELEKIVKGVDLIGINNRNLKDFQIDMDRSLRLLASLPDDAIKISESGLSNPETVNYLRRKGFHGFLMGENFMKTEDPAATCKNFISKIIND